MPHHITYTWSMCIFNARARMLKCCNIVTSEKPLSWDVIEFLFVVAVIVCLDYFGFFG